MALFIGSPLYAFYLRALGAKVGRGAVILSPMPVCTDLVTIGDGAVIRKASVLTGYRALDGVIQTGPVHVGNDVLVGENTVLGIGTSLGDGAQLGHSSSLHPGQTVPGGERWHGSPAQRSGMDSSGCRRRTPAPGDGPPTRPRSWWACSESVRRWASSSWCSRSGRFPPLVTCSTRDRLLSPAGRFTATR